MREKMSKQPPPTPTASAIGPCSTIIQISRMPRHWKFTQYLRTTRPPQGLGENNQQMILPFLIRCYHATWYNAALIWHIWGTVLFQIEIQVKESPTSYWVTGFEVHYRAYEKDSGMLTFLLQQPHIFIRSSDKVSIVLQGMCKNIRAHLFKANRVLVNKTLNF